MYKYKCEDTPRLQQGAMDRLTMLRLVPHFTLEEMVQIRGLLNKTESIGNVRNTVLDHVGPWLQTQDSYYYESCIIDKQVI